MRSAKASALFLVGAALSACFVGAGDDPTEQSDDALTFRATPVDDTLPEVDALGYEIDLAVSDVPGSESFRATVKGTFTATADLTELPLDFEGNTIDVVTVSGRRAEHRREGSRLVITLPTPITKGRRFSTRIAYHGDLVQADGSDPNDFNAFGGFMVKQRNSENKRIYTTLSWPSKARRWLPLRDHPRDAAQVAFTATWPKSFTVLANGERVSTKENADGTKTWRYQALTPMPTYDFHVSAYEGWKTNEWRSESASLPLASYSYARSAGRAEDVYADLPKALDFYEGAFGKYRWGTASFIEEPIFGGGMEHASVVSMDETLFPDPEEARRVAFHELAHHWSGNLVRFRTWNDFWLSEGFTEYLTARAVAQLDGADAAKKIYRWYLTASLDADKTNPHAIAPAGAEIDVLSIFDAISYQKGALAVRMLERIVGEPTLTAFLGGWFERHGFGAPVTTDDLQRELEQASGKNLSGFFRTFVRAGYHPEVRVTLAPAGAETEIKVEQVQEQGPAGGFVFPLDLDLVDASGQKERVTVELTGKTTVKRMRPARTPASVIVDPDEYAIAVSTCGQSGGTCKPDFRCAARPGAASVCLPR